MNAATIRMAFGVILPAVLMVLVPRMARAADDVGATGETMAFRLLDADSGAAIANARVVIASAWEYWVSDKRRHSLSLRGDPMEVAEGSVPDPAGGKSAPSGGPRFTTVYKTSDGDGRFVSRIPAGDMTLSVMHERGIAFFREGEWNRQGGDLAIKLQPWASVSGTVTCNGKPAAGVVITFSRSYGDASIGAMVSFYTAPIQHGAAVRTDGSGRFAIARLLPTSVDGAHDVPYSAAECLMDGPALTDEELKRANVGDFGVSIRGGGTSMTVRRGQRSFAPGEKARMDFAVVPRCEREVTGRLVWADGAPVSPADIQNAAFEGKAVITFFPILNLRGSGSASRVVIDADGRFKTTLALAGKWGLTAGDLRPIGQKSKFEFSLPPPKDDSGKDERIDLGDIVFQRTVRMDPAAPRADDQGMVELVFTVVDDKTQPLDDATARIERLESGGGTSRYLYPKDLPRSRSGADGVARVKVPAHYRDAEGKDWDIAHTALEITKNGFEPLTWRFALGEKGAVVAMRTSYSVALRVIKEGRAMALDQVQIGAGWTGYGWNAFEHRKWKQDERLILRRVDVPQGAWQVQAGHIDPDRWRWFSQVAELDPTKSGPPTELVLRRGVRLEGEIDPAVPRPVKSGMVRVMVRMPPPSSVESWPIFWSDWQQTDTKGKFSFRGLPPGDAWIAASCEGWISAQPERGQSEVSRQTGDPNWGGDISTPWTARPFRVATESTDVTVPMTRTGTVVFHFKNRDGTSLAGAFPLWDPRLDLGPDRQNLAETNRSIDHLLSEPDENRYFPGAFLPRLVHQTDATGIVRLENLPPGRMRLGMMLQNARLQPVESQRPKSDHPYDGFAPFQADVKPGAVVEKEFIVSPVDR